jgi:AraC-like DNA-binding protein
MARYFSPEKMQEMAEAAHFHPWEFAKLYGRSPRQTQRHIIELFGCSPRDWLNTLKLAAAEKRLLEGDRIKDVAEDVSFEQTPQFCRWFKKTTNLTPSQYKARLAKRGHLRSKAVLP